MQGQENHGIGNTYESCTAYAEATFSRRSGPEGVPVHPIALDFFRDFQEYERGAYSMRSAKEERSGGTERPRQGLSERAGGFRRHVSNSLTVELLMGTGGRDCL